MNEQDLKLIADTYKEQYALWQTADAVIKNNIYDVRQEIAVLEKNIEDITININVLDYEIELEKEKLGFVKNTLNKVLSKETPGEIKLAKAKQSLAAIHSVIREREAQLYALIVSYDNHAKQAPNLNFYEIAMYGGSLFKVV